MVALLKFKGKPRTAATMELILKLLRAMYIHKNLTTSGDGEVTFNLSREGFFCFCACCKNWANHR